MACSQSVYGSKQPMRGCSALPSSWRDDWSWLSGWVSHGEYTSVCMVTHWTRPTISHDLRLSSSHDLTKMLYYIVSQPWENIELMLKLVMTLTYSEIVSWSYIPYELGHCWWKPIVISIFNRNTMISHGIETVCLLRWS